MTITTITTTRTSTAAPAMISRDRRRPGSRSPAADCLVPGAAGLSAGRRAAASPGPGHGPVSQGGASPTAAVAPSGPHGGAPAAAARPARSAPAEPLSSQDSVIESGSSPARPAGRNHSACSLASAAQAGSDSAAAGAAAIWGSSATALRTAPVPADDDIDHQASIRSELTVLMLGQCHKNVWITPN